MVGNPRKGRKESSVIRLASWPDARMYSHPCQITESPGVSEPTTSSFRLSGDQMTPATLARPGDHRLGSPPEAGTT